ncbi:hypothetical protein H310_07461 [Aphanomyces invadans]|uniref:Uncharacterized protein n=1 Tax=Aphanomyces invadans TaxID=157072 RepID=A0A024U0S8_9STRA|nr:hypothetical protein H310_07461 [Aphanomyces invadans]ETW00021.1 hypothetical protein H310_07461 [Aphanomyces invadans]|eukprot:XP_008871046.1 hypothetical protein H310_07461 [Aphanomyces invadans]
MPSKPFNLALLAFPIDAVVASSALYFYTGAVTICVCVAAYFVLMRLTRQGECDATCYRAPPSGLSEPNRWTILRKSFRQQLLVMLMYFTTLCLWPPLITEMKSFNCPDLQASGWWPQILLTVFSVVDCVGRLLVPWRCGLTKDSIWKPVFLRMLLIPCIVMTVRQVWFTHDAWSVMFVVLLGLSNGYIGTLTIQFVNESVDSSERAIASSFTGFFLISGLMVGSAVGLVYIHFTHA